MYYVNAYYDIIDDEELSTVCNNVLKMALPSMIYIIYDVIMRSNIIHFPVIYFLI